MAALTLIRRWCGLQSNRDLIVRGGCIPSNRIDIAVIGFRSIPKRCKARVRLKHDKRAIQQEVTNVTIGGAVAKLYGMGGRRRSGHGEGVVGPGCIVSTGFVRFVGGTKPLVISYRNFPMLVTWMQVLTYI